MKTIARTTKVISISLPEDTAANLEKARKQEGASRSAFIGRLIDDATEALSWNRIYKKGQETAQKYAITSEDDIDAILHST